MADLKDIIMSEQDTLVNILNKYDPSSIEHSDEICSRRVTNPQLRDERFWTADLPLYHVEGKEVFLYMARRQDNIIFQKTEDASDQLRNTKKYIPSVEDAQKVMKSVTTLKVKVSDLGLMGEMEDCGYFNVSTIEYDRLNPSQRALAERAYGSGDDFIRYMAALRECGKKLTFVWVLKSNHVKKNVGQDNVLCQASILYDFGNFSGFDANVSCIYENRKRALGVYQIRDVYKTLLHPNIQHQALSMMTPKIASGLSRLLAAYSAKKENKKQK